MANIVYRILEEYNLMERLHCITSDNASNNYALTRELSNKLRRDAGIEWNYETQHLPCLAHVINLLVKKLLSASNGIRSVQDRDRNSPRPGLSVPGSISVRSLPEPARFGS
jgi:hypothetical protein